MLFTPKDLVDSLGGEATITADQADVIHQRIVGFIEGTTTLALSRYEDRVVVVPGGGAHLTLPRRPVVSVSAVEYEDADGEWVALDTTYWRLTPRGIRKTYGSAWSGDWYRITYTYGYDVVPEDIKAVALSAAIAMATNPSGTRSEGLGSYNVTYGGNDEELSAFLGPLMSKALSRYRRKGRTVVMSL